MFSFVVVDDGLAEDDPAAFPSAGTILLLLLDLDDDDDFTFPINTLNMRRINH